MTRPRRPPLLLALALALAGGAAAACGDQTPGGELALRQALASTAGRTEGRLNPTPGPLDGAAPHRMIMHCTIRLEAPGGARLVEITRALDRGAGGRFHLVDDRVATEPDLPRVDDGREAIYDGDRLASRRRYGPWIERDLLYGGGERLLREAYDLATGVLQAFGDYIRWQEEPAPDEQLAGLAVRRAAASLDPRVAPKPLDKGALAALRDHATHWPVWVAATHRPSRVEGTLARTKAGEVVAGKLEISGIATVEGTQAPFSVSIDYAVSDLPKGATFAVPPNVLPEARERTWRMIQDVLGDDLTAPYRPR